MLHSVGGFAISSDGYFYNFSRMDGLGVVISIIHCRVKKVKFVSRFSDEVD